jgi:hypothetical protein
MPQETRSVTAYAQNDSANGNPIVVRKQIEIPAGWRYISHSMKILKENPRGGSGRRWWATADFIRKPNTGRIDAVYVEAKAGIKDSFGPSVWVGVQLDVVMESVF